MRRKIPPTQALICFESSARHESFTKAAEELALTQSAVCRQIANLEEFLDVQLFRRTRRGVKLTEAGQTYSRRVASRLDAVAAQIDHICRATGDTRHAAIGSDLDGGYGTEQTPRDLDTIVDLQKIPQMLAKRGYAQDDLQAIMHGNWVRLFRQAWS